METRKTLFSICLVVVMVCLPGISLGARGSKSQTATPKGWPGRTGKRKLYIADFGYVYAGSKSSVAKMEKIVRKVREELDKEGVQTGGKGLVFVLGKKEKPPFEIQTLLARTTRNESEKKEEQYPQKAIEKLKEGKKKYEELGLDMNLMLSIMTLPIEPNILPDLIKGFPKDAGRQIDWCVVIPTESNIKYGMSKVLDAGLKKEKVGGVKKLALYPILAIAERKAVGEIKKGRQRIFYEYMVDIQEHLTDQQKEDMKKSYEERL